MSKKILNARTFGVWSDLPAKSFYNQYGKTGDAKSRDDSIEA